MLDPLLSLLSGVGYALETPGALTRGAIGNAADLLSGKNHTQGMRGTGREMMESLGLIGPNNEDRFDAGDVIGTAADLAVDPLNWLGAGLIGKLLRTNKAAAVAKTPDLQELTRVARAAAPEAAIPRAPAAAAMPELANYSAAKEGAGIADLGVPGEEWKTNLSALEEEWARRSIKGSNDYRAARKEAAKRTGGFLEAEEGNRITQEAQSMGAASDAEMAALKAKIIKRDKTNTEDVRRIFGDELADQGAFPSPELPVAPVSPLQEMAMAKADAQVASSAIKPTKRMLKTQQEAERKAQITANELADLAAFKAKTEAAAAKAKTAAMATGKVTKEMRDAGNAATIAADAERVARLKAAGKPADPFVREVPEPARVKAKKQAAPREAADGPSMMQMYERTRQVREMEEIFGKELMSQGAYPDPESLEKAAESLKQMKASAKAPAAKRDAGLDVSNPADMKLSNKPRNKMTPAEIDRVDRIRAENLEQNISMHLRTVQGLAADEAKQLASGTMKKKDVKGWQKEVDRLSGDLAEIKANHAAKYGETYWGEVAAAPKPVAPKPEATAAPKAKPVAAKPKAATKVWEQQDAGDLVWDAGLHEWVRPKAKPAAAKPDPVKFRSKTNVEIERMDRAKAADTEKALDRRLETLQDLAADEAEKLANGTLKYQRGWQKDVDALKEQIAVIKARHAKKFGGTPEQSEAEELNKGLAAIMKRNKKTSAEMDDFNKAKEENVARARGEPVAAKNKEAIVRAELERIFGKELTEGRHLPMP